jgi:hypothetical protein
MAADEPALSVPCIHCVQFSAQAAVWYWHVYEVRKFSLDGLRALSAFEPGHVRSLPLHCTAISVLRDPVKSPRKAIGHVDRARRGLFECRLGTRIMHRAEPRAEKLDNDYFVIIKRFRRRRRAHRTGWTWVIQRRSKRLAVKFDGDEYVTPQAAKLAGETALKELLNNRIQRAI